ncbi:hypothetical protein EDD86DRAFT_185328 [Gorgonomyces haynaldii]|nr:hypothetical protein EDD86DRAFT_185328 [Gorgonomyces haynaldii]
MGRAQTSVLRTGIARPGTSMQMGIPPSNVSQIPEGKITSTVYQLIRDARYQEVIKLLTTEIQTRPKSRSCLSLLAYCYYQTQDFLNAADCYEQLVQICPDSQDYKLYFAQSLYKSGQHQMALKVSNTVEGQLLARKILKLQASIKYEMDDIPGAKAICEQLPQDDPDTMINEASLLFKEAKYEDACLKYSEAAKIVGFVPEIAYDIALCFYMLQQYVPALKNIAEIIERAIRDHPELGIAKEALLDMPPRQEHELDQVTLHNQALMNMDSDPAGGFEKLGFLLQQMPCPPETFGNMLLLYCKYQYYDSAADLLAENLGIASATLSPYLYDFLDATLMKTSAPEEAYKKFDDLANRHLDVLRKLTKKVQEARSNHDDDLLKRCVNDFDDEVERYIPILMAQARIYWDMENYAMVEKIFRKSVEFCNEHDTWKLNVAHVLFMQESKYKEAISFYEPLVKKQYDNVLEVTAIVLANLCVSYIMTSQNEEAEELMRRIEKEEERMQLEDQSKRSYHLCIVNLVIGTLYCSKGNYEFGISRIMKSLEPFNKKLGTDTWYYAKRCFVSLYETLAKHMIILKDQVYQEILEFFDNCEIYGRHLPVVVDPLAPNADQSPTGNRLYDSVTFDASRNSVASEARHLKSLFLRLYD